VPAPIQVGKRWVVERTHSWMNGYGKLRRCTDKDGDIVDFFLYLAASLRTVRQLIQKARKRYRWTPDRPPAASSDHLLPSLLDETGVMDADGDLGPGWRRPA